MGGDPDQLKNIHYSDIFGIHTKFIVKSSTWEIHAMQDGTDMIHRDRQRELKMQHLI